MLIKRPYAEWPEPLRDKVRPYAVFPMDPSEDLSRDDRIDRNGAVRQPLLDGEPHRMRVDVTLALKIAHMVRGRQWVRQGDPSGEVHGIGVGKGHLGGKLVLLER